MGALIARPFVVATVGGGAYDLGAWVQYQQLRGYGYKARFYLGYSERQPLSVAWSSVSGVVPVLLDFEHGWTSKALIVSQVEEPVVLFLDADVYPLGKLPRLSSSRVWPNIAGYCALDADFFGLPRRARQGLDGGVWVIDKDQDADVWRDYVALNSQWRTTYAHGFGDQDILLAAWERAGKDLPLVGSRPTNYRGVGTHFPSPPFPGFIHRWRRKLGFSSSHFPSLPDESKVRLHVREYRRILSTSSP